MELKFNINMLLYPALVTLTAFCVALYYDKKDRRSIFVFVLIFFILLGAEMAFGEPYYDIYGDVYNFEAKMTDQQRLQFHQKEMYHLQQGQIFCESMQNRCLLLPPGNYRNSSLTAIGVCVAAIASGKPRSAAVIALLATLESYLKAVYNQWNAIRDDLNNAKYHFEMAEFYNEILFRDRFNY